jgi:PAS domain S-box-containing protein
MNKRITHSVLGMSVDMNRDNMLLVLLACVAILFFLTPDAYFVMPPRDFLPLHTLLEFSSVLVAFMIFGVIWHSLSSTQSTHISLLGCAMLASGSLDFAHILSYTGMPDFVTPSSPEKSLTFLLAARFTLATAFCVASFIHTAPLHEPQHRYALLFGFSLYALSIYWLVLFNQSVSLHIFNESYGIAEFKMTSEWGIIGLFVIAASRFWRLTYNTGDHNSKSYFFPIVMIFIMSEIFFILYKSTGDTFDILSHFYKILGYFLLYQSLFVTAIRAPYLEIGQQQIRYRQLFDNMTSCCAIYQAVDNGDDFVFLEVNHATEHTERIGRDNFIGRRVTELFPGAADFGLLDALRRVGRTGQAEHFPVKYYQDGRIVGWRENYVYRLGDGNIVAIYDDITEHKLAEQALLKSEKYFRAIFETAAIGMAEADPMTGKFSRVNLKFCQMTGYSVKELLSKTFSMITHPDDQEKNLEGWQLLLRGETPEYITEKRYIHKDGHEIWALLNVIALRDENGMILRTVAAIADITAHKQAEDDRCHYDQELKSIFDALPDFYFRLGSDGTILSYRANPTATSNLYVPPEQFLGRRMIDVLPSEQAALFAAKIEEQQSSGKIIAFEYQLTVASGERSYEARLANPAYCDDIIVLVRDITELKQLKQQLQQAQKMEALGQLTGGIAHDFNNILAAILGYSNLAMERCVSDPSDKLARYLGEVISAGERARDLITKMLAYSRTSSVVGSTPLDMISEVEKAVAMLSFAIPAGIDVVTHIDPYVPSVRIDPIDVQQVLINLVVNSRDAIGEQGRIDITLERARINNKACAICHNIIDGDYVALEVKDSGNGIPDKIQQRIFDPFFTTKDVGKGTGLGLSVVQGIVRRAGGCIVIDSHLGMGTTVQVLFPVAEAFVDLPPATVPSPEISGRNGARILVVDDESALAHYLGDVLEGENYEVNVYTDSVKALNYFCANPQSIDAVITDQTMPNKSGIVIARVMLALRPDLPIFLCSGYSNTIDEADAQSLGIRRFFYKPVSATELLTALNEEIGVVANIQRH